MESALGLVALVAVAAAVGGASRRYGFSGPLALGAVGGVVVGVVVAVVLIAIRTRVQDPVVDTSLSLLAPFLAYLPSEYIHASGVLAVVVTGLMFGHRSPLMQSAASRISERTNWRTLQFLLESTVFLLIGLQASVIIGAVRGDPLGAGTVAVAAVGVLVTAIVIRPLWVFPVAYARRLLPSALRRRETPPWLYPTLVSWAGMRGVVTLAAAFVIPSTVPHRDVLVFIALVVVGGTLLVQGSTLTWLMRRLGVRGPDAGEDALQQAVVFRQTTAAGLRRLEEVGGDSAPELVQEIARPGRDTVRRDVGAARREQADAQGKLRGAAYGDARGRAGRAAAHPRLGDSRPRCARPSAGRAGPRGVAARAGRGGHLRSRRRPRRACAARRPMQSPARAAAPGCEPAHGGPLRCVRRRGARLGAPAHVHVVRQCRVLRLVERQAREAPRSAIAKFWSSARCADRPELRNCGGVQGASGRDEVDGW